MMKIVVGPMIAGNANLNQNDLVVGMPSPMAALGYSGLLCRRLMKKNGFEGNPWFSKVLPIYHQITPSLGRVKPLPGLGSKGKEEIRKSLKNTEIAETFTGEVIFSLLIDIPGEHDLADISREVQALRFAGSAVFGWGWDSRIQVQLLDFKNVSELRLPRGFAASVPQNTCDTYVVSDVDDLEMFAKRLSRTAQSGEGYLVASAVGMRLLENPETAEIRPGSRSENIAHVYVESVAGLSEMISVRNEKIAQAHPDELDKLMWSWSCDGGHDYVMFSKNHLESMKDKGENHV